MIGVLTMHGHRQWKFLESTGGGEQQFICLIHDNVLIQHVLELIGGKNALYYIVLSSQKYIVDNVNIYDQKGHIDHNQIHVNIKKVKSSTVK